MSRAAKQIIILGFNGTGKTTLTRKFVNRALRRKEKVLVITPDFAEWTDIPETLLDRPSDFEFTGVRRFIWEDSSVLKKINLYYFNGLIVFDDCRAYLSAVTDPELKRLYIRRRQKMIDIIMCGHGFTDVPPQAFTNCSEFILFLTKDNISRRKNVILNYDKVAESQARVNLRAMDLQKCWVDKDDVTQNIHYYEVVRP